MFKSEYLNMLGIEAKLKVCESCNQINGARAYNCKKCGHPFKMKNGAVRYSKKAIEDWTTLKEGDCFRVLKRSGDYYIKDNGEKHHWTRSGGYRVKELTIDNKNNNHGIACYGLTNRNSGYHWLYMGPERPETDSTMCFKSPHKIVRIKDPIR